MAINRVDFVQPLCLSCLDLLSVETDWVNDPDPGTLIALAALDRAVIIKRNLPSGQYDATIPLVDGQEFQLTVYDNHSASVKSVLHEDEPTLWISSANPEVVLAAPQEKRGRLHVLAYAILSWESV